MIEFREDSLGVSFKVPETMSVREQLRYIRAVTAVNKDDNEDYIRFWEGMKPFIEDWECEVMPDYKKSIDEMYSLDQVNVIIWSGTIFRLHVNKIGNAEKN